MAKQNTNTSIVDYLKSQGKDSSYSARKKIAESMGITNYSGTASQNVQMLDALKSGAYNKNSTTSTMNTPSTNNTNETKNSNITNKNTMPKASGVDNSVLGVMTSAYTPSEVSKGYSEERSSANDRVKEVTSKNSVVSQANKDVINSTYTESPIITQATALLKGQLSKIQSGRTSYTDQVKDMMSKIQNREKFSYDVNADPLFQQALGSAMVSGQQAMQNTIGQASALTGGYGSSYATSAGNQAYNSFIQDAYDNLPQYYNMALQAYQMEGEDMYRQFSMFSEADDKEFNRNLSAYDATFNFRNQMRNEDYGMFRDKKSDAFASANLEMSEHNQLVSDALSYYNTVADMDDTQYQREYTSWADQVAQANTLAGIQNGDYWNNIDNTYRYASLAQADEHHDEDRNWSNFWNEKDLIYKYNSLNAKGEPVEVEYKKLTPEEKEEAFIARTKGTLEKYLASFPEEIDIPDLMAYIEEEEKKARDFWNPFK